MQKFSLETVNAMYEKAPIVEQKSFDKAGKSCFIYVKDIKAITEYISQYFFAVKNGDHYVFDGSEFEANSQETLKKVYFDLMPPRVSHWYSKENNKINTLLTDNNRT